MRVGHGIVTSSIHRSTILLPFNQVNEYKPHIEDRLLNQLLKILIYLVIPVSGMKPTYTFFLLTRLFQLSDYSVSPSLRSHH